MPRCAAPVAVAGQRTAGGRRHAAGGRRQSLDDTSREKRVKSLRVVVQTGAGELVREADSVGPDAVPRFPGHWIGRAHADPARVIEEARSEWWTADRPVRQDRAAGDRPRSGRRRPPGAGAVRRTRARPRARAHLSDHPAGAVERTRRRTRRRAGRRRADHLLAFPRAAAAARGHRRDHGPLRPAAAGQEPRPRPDPGLARSGGAGRGQAAQEDRPHARSGHRRRHRGRASLRARPPQAGTAQGGLARRRPRRVRRRRGA